MRGSVITGRSMCKHGAGIVATGCKPEVLMRVAVKSGFALQKVVVADFIETNDGSCRA